MNQFKTIEQVWTALDKGLTIYWASDAYKLTIEETLIDWRKQQGFHIPFSNRDGQCLRVTCISNWFGSLLDQNELNRLYTKGS